MEEPRDNRPPFPSPFYVRDPLGKSSLWWQNDGYCYVTTAYEYTTPSLRNNPR